MIDDKIIENDITVKADLDWKIDGVKSSISEILEKIPFLEARSEQVFDRMFECEVGVKEN